MDLMKANTRYTMKAKTASGTFTIDGTSYGAGTNGTFTTPSSMTNKLLVMSNKTNEEVMILEGNVTDKTIPYFKGIKSAFEGEDKIEVLSTGKNLFDGEMRLGAATTFSAGKPFDECFSSGNLRCYSQPFEVGNTEKVSIILTNPNHKYAIYQWDNNKGYIVGTSWLTQSTALTLRSNTKYVSVYTANIDDSPVAPSLFTESLQIEVANSPTTYEPHKSNSAKIPLLSPLRSLPNGVCDELIIDRMKKKATLIQRVGVGVLDGTQNINMVDSSVDTSLYQPFFCGAVFENMAIAPHNVVVARCDRLLANSNNPAYRGLTFNAIYQYTDSSARLAGQITKKDLGVKSVKDWFRANPTTIYYQLATPVVTEVDLENFPLVYKDGHIFLNSEIAPVVEINYNVNQAQQIQSNNETLQRHELDILDLDNLIVSFVNAEYNLRLLKFDMELSMMALAE